MGALLFVLWRAQLKLLNTFKMELALACVILANGGQFSQDKMFLCLCFIEAYALMSQLIGLRIGEQGCGVGRAFFYDDNSLPRHLAASAANLLEKAGCSDRSRTRTVCIS
jgi:hypothetical protein